MSLNGDIVSGLDKTCVDVSMCGLKISYGGDVAEIECNAVKIWFGLIVSIFSVYIII